MHHGLGNAGQACCFDAVAAAGAASLHLVEETGEDLVFLHQVQAGGASRSYGIEAARLAGVPKPVVQRARQVLDQLAA